MTSFRSMSVMVMVVVVVSVCVVNGTTSISMVPTMVVVMVAGRGVVPQSRSAKESRRRIVIMDVTKVAVTGAASHREI